MSTNRLFTPGPLSTSPTVKSAMLTDLGSRDEAFIARVAEVRRRMVALAGDPAVYTAVPMQGSGTFCIEAVLTSVVPPAGAVLIVSNGAYGRRMATICQVSGIRHRLVEFPEERPPDAATVQRALADLPDASLLAVVHCETSTGMINPVGQFGAVARRAGARFFVDAMSSFGAIPLHMAELGVDFLVTSANKCIQGVPGFGWILARRAALEATAGWARSLSLDVHAQWRGLQRTGQFRFTPPTHALLAFHQALLELEREGGVAGRANRYRDNHRLLVEGMRQLGFREYLPPELQGYIITSFLYPRHERWSFSTFYERLNARGFVIYPGKVSQADCFRIGSIGHLFPDDMRGLLAAIREVLADMGVAL